MSRRSSSILRIHGGREARAISSHFDLALTLVAMTAAAPDKKTAITAALKGKAFRRF